MARKLTPALQAELVKVLAIGNYVETACRYVGLKPATFWDWMKKGQDEGSGVYWEFREAMLRAEAQAEVAAIASVRRHFDRDPRAALEFLARKYPTKWGRNSSVEVNIHSQAGVARDQGPSPDEALDVLTPEQVDMFARQMSQLESLPAPAKPSDGDDGQ